MVNTENAVDRLAAILEEILKSIPLVRALEVTRGKAASARAEMDLQLDLTLHDGTRPRMIVEFKTSGHPRSLREAVRQLVSYRDNHDSTAYPVVAAPFISSGGADLCRREGVGFCDLAGNCRLLFAGLFVERTGRPNPFPRTAHGQDLYAPKCERVLRVLLADPYRGWKVAQLGREAGVSLGTVSTVRKLLLEREWAKESKGGVLLHAPSDLLKDWGEVWGRRRFKARSFVSLDVAGTTERRVADVASQGLPARKFAITGMSAAWRHAEWVRYEHVLAYWSGDPDELAAAAKLKPADKGANVHLIVPRDDGVFFGAREISGVPVVSPIQTYLDLKWEPGRGAEAAEFLWNTVLFPGNVTRQ